MRRSRTVAAAASIAALALASCATFHDQALRSACAAKGDDYIALHVDGTVTWNDVTLESMDDVDTCLEIALGVVPIARVHFSLDPGTTFDTVAKFLREVQRKAGQNLGFIANFRSQ